MANRVPFHHVASLFPAMFATIVLTAATFYHIQGSKPTISGDLARLEAGDIEDSGRRPSDYNFPSYIPTQGRISRRVDFWAFNANKNSDLSTHEAAFSCWFCSIIYCIAALIVLLVALLAP